MPIFTKEISVDSELGHRREYRIRELSINDNSIFLHGEVYYLHQNGTVISKIPPFTKRISVEPGKAPYVNPNTGIYTEPVYDTDEESETFGQITNNVITRYEFLMMVFSYVSIVVESDIDDFVNRADIAGEFEI